MSRRVVVAAMALGLLIVAVGGHLVWRQLDRSDYERAVAAMPAETLRATYTDCTST